MEREILLRALGVKKAVGIEAKEVEYPKDTQ
jgi:hypothetical protein